MFKIGTIRSNINGNISVNIAHFFHENLFYALDAFLRNKSIGWILHTGLSEWENKFTVLCAKYLNISIVYEDLGEYRNPNYNLHISNNENYSIIMNLIQSFIKSEYPDITYNPNYKVLYFRDDAYRRKMIAYKNTLNKYFDEIIYDFNTLSFEAQVKLCMKCSHFVTIEGACLTNIIFMNKLAKVLNISTTDNSWQLMFGTSNCVSVFDRYTIGTANFDDNIQYSDSIENKILNFINN